MHTEACAGETTGARTVPQGPVRAGLGEDNGKQQVVEAAPVTGGMLGCHLPSGGQGHCLTAGSPVRTTQIREIAVE